MNADAKVDPLIRHNVGVPAGHCELDLGRTARGINGAGELDEQTVARRFDDATTVRSDRGVNEVPPDCLQAGQRALLVCPHKPTVPRDISRQYGRQPPLNPLARQDVPSAGGIKHGALASD